MNWQVDPQAIGDRIQRTRKAYGWTLADLAQKTNVPVGTVSAYEGGHRIPRWPQAVALARVLRRTLDFLILGRRDRVNRRPPE